MFRINKNERDYLIKHQCTYPNDLHSTLRGKTYATASPKVLALLQQYHTNSIVK